ncbi:MAG: hypothetical protein KAR05_04075 [Candidatus Omnitrophica bacterium]|nr:hypothetical protein [Candidatus Omnitrophota bacterium]
MKELPVLSATLCGGNYRGMIPRLSDQISAVSLENNDSISENKEQIYRINWSIFKRL